jgi:23S rRNA pseudouridine2605 synthase
MKKSAQQFKKFATKKSNAAIKENFRKEKRELRKEREAFFDKKRAAAKPQRPPVTGGISGKASNDHGTRGNVSGEEPLRGTELMPLNKFIAHSGITARREAAEMVKKGLVKVNGEVVLEPGHKVGTADLIIVNSKKIFLKKNLIYILLNKPKDYLTTTNDPQQRKTVMDIVKRATTERVYPVGRLDRNTSGVLLLTNDGELAQKLAHPSNEIKKVYSVTLNRPFDKKDFDRLLKGVNLEDGLAKVDSLAYSDAQDRSILGVEIHSGRNRIVRRIFEFLGYDVKNLDRVIFAGLTKKNIERGKWRFLTEKEVRDLKYFGKGK